MFCTCKNYKDINYASTKNAPTNFCLAQIFLPRMHYMMILQFLYFWNENLKFKIYIYVK
jgi:hypothetical protein